MSRRHRNSRRSTSSASILRNSSTAPPVPARTRTKASAHRRHTNRNTERSDRRPIVLIMVCMMAIAAAIALANMALSPTLAGATEADKGMGLGNSLHPNSPNVRHTVVYFHRDHLGSVTKVTDANGQVVSQQEYDPWGQVHSGGVPQTTLNYTGQRLDNTGLLYYGARYYDPVLGRFVSPDSIVPGKSLGAGGAFGVVGQQQNSNLTVDFHETGFVNSLNGENRQILEKGFSFQLDEEARQRAQELWGPKNPQTLNRFAYVVNNPLRYIDPTGHSADPDDVGNMFMQEMGMPVGRLVFEGLRLASKMLGQVFRSTGDELLTVARLGGRHSGFLKALHSQGPNQIRSTIESLAKNIDNHIKWINNPKLKYADWDRLSADMKERILNSWAAEIRTFSEEIQLAHSYLKGLQGGK